jgi:diguanylate cyclase (GGDEF)-like protein
MTLEWSTTAWRVFAGRPQESVSASHVRTAGRAAEALLAKSGSESTRLVLACAPGPVRNAAPRWLAAEGFDVSIAHDGDEALRLIREQPPSIALTDLSLRDSSGRLVLHAIRDLPAAQGLPLLVFCASERLVDSAIEAGATDVVQAPFNWRAASLRAARLARFRPHTEAPFSRTDHVETAAADTAQASRAVQRDPVTGLPVRSHFETVVDRAIASAPGDTHGVVALVNLDHFVTAKRTLGRAGANAILKQVAQQITAAVRSEELIGRVSGASITTVARLDGEVFGVLLTGLATRDDAVRSVQLLHDRTARTLAEIDGGYALTASAGAAIAPSDGRTAEALLLRADLALDQARMAGGAVRFHNEANYQHHAGSLPIHRCLLTALARGEMHLHYQPLIDRREGRVTAAEALLRWDSPELGRVAPATFVPVAEESGLMVQVGTWVLGQACRQLRTWINQGLPAIRMCVNVSLCQLVRSDLVRVVRETLAETGIEPGLLELEISERGVFHSDPEILRQLHELKKLGVRLSLDDFGTGNSAIACVKHFPIDTIKIDRSFVSGVTSSASDAAIAGATIAMARQLGLNIVAEGVEQGAQLEFLSRHGCENYQGYFFSEPIAATAFGELLAKWRLPESGESRVVFQALESSP